MADSENAGDQAVVDAAVAEGGNYEVIRGRLTEQGRELASLTRALNTSRADEFGSEEMAVRARIRVRTENNCTARDIVQVGDQLLFAYNVFIGLKSETKVEDVFALFKPVERDGTMALEPVEQAGTFLAAPGFVQDFAELYRYYKQTQLVQLLVHEGRLLAAFRIGERVEDVRVFRWSVAADGTPTEYIDNRGERDIALPPSFDFEWLTASREDVVSGRHPHLNILDTVFVEAVGGDLTVKVENNTEQGLGIYSEPVDDQTQSVTDAEVEYAGVGDLILLRIRPYREENWRHLVFNRLTEQVTRVDAIARSCVQLPEDHGIIFPGGYYLQSGEHKAFEVDSPGLSFRRSIRSPNGEDVMFIFYDVEDGLYSLIGYNLIEKTLRRPIDANGYALSDDGTLTVFSAEEEAGRVHPMEVWSTPYVSAEFAARQPPSQTELGRIGNAELVRGISDCYSLVRAIAEETVSARRYEELGRAAAKLAENHGWLADMAPFAGVVGNIVETVERVIDEFDKVASIRRQSAEAMAEAEAVQSTLLLQVNTATRETALDHVELLGRLRRQRGHLTTLRDYRYVDLARLDELEAALLGAEDEASRATVAFLADPEALVPYRERIEALDAQVAAAATMIELTPCIEAIDEAAAGLDLLSELMATLKVDDTNLRTRIVDAISEVYGVLNQSRARARNRQGSMGLEEASADFSSRFKLLSQSIVNALELASTPERCDEQLSRLLVQLEELESQFSQYDQFLTDIITKREEVYESFDARKQQLLEARQRKAQSLVDAAERILASVEKRTARFADADELNTFFAADALVLKARELIASLVDLDSAVQADDLDARLKAVRADALRSLRDSADLFEDGGNVIRLGPRHRFSVNTQALDLTIIPRNGEPHLHLTGTQYFEPVRDEQLLALREYWDMTLESESPDVYRGEFLAAGILEAAERHEEGLSLESLGSAVAEPDAMLALARDYAAPRYKDGYERGIHDHDAALILRAVLPALELADTLRHDPLSRGLAQVFWAEAASPRAPVAREVGQAWAERARSAAELQATFSSSAALDLLRHELRDALAAFLAGQGFDAPSHVAVEAARYLVAELSRDRLEFARSKYGERLAVELRATVSDQTWRRYRGALEQLAGEWVEQWRLTEAWLSALVAERGLGELARYVPEAIAILNADALDRRSTEADLDLRIEGLLGQHAGIADGVLAVSLDSYLARIAHHREVVLPGFHQCQHRRHEVLTEERRRLRLGEFTPRPLSSFVRNRLIDECYLPIIGDNLAKQMGTVGDTKRTDLMGLLMMISPPGYGKTTLMEYVASRLGLIFMKVNCPSLGHEVVSLDPAQAPNATARQELEKINLAFEMGNNVMLYLDDIQHTDPEFLQKFISLCDGTRRVEGVWRGETKTYDLRGRKFCVVMAGNPYTESGDVFRIPDMLANRADIYNLGDILGGMEAQFELSYVENALTSNAVLAPLASRDMADVYRLADMAAGMEVASGELVHPYSNAEVKEMVDVLGKLFFIRDVVLRVNQQYIASAAQDDQYRTEPPFKLQGSYRNMNKMAEKVSAVMVDDELQQLVADHYVGEAQLLTTGAEANLLKLAELRGTLDGTDAERWEAIKQGFVRNRSIGGDDVDVGGKVVGQLVDLVGAVKALQSAAVSASEPAASIDDEAEERRRHELRLLVRGLAHIGKVIAENRANVEVINQPVPGMDKVLASLANTIETSFLPLIRHMDKKLEIDLTVHNRLENLARDINSLRTELPARSPGVAE